MTTSSPLNASASPPARPVRRLVVMVLSVGVLLALVFGWGALRSMFISRYLAALKDKPQSVSTTVAKMTPFVPKLAVTGNLIAIQGANLSSQIAGIVDTIDFRSGSDVKAGQALLTLRPDNDDAVLAQLEASAQLAAITYRRDLAQYRANAVSLQTVDADRANLASSEAQVRSQKALMAEKVVRAPFSGRIGIRQVDLGQYLPAGTAIASLQQLNPIDVDFYVPQDDLAVIRPGMNIAIRVGGFSGVEFRGTIKAADSAISTQTLMVQVRGTLHNPHDELRPGSFVHVTIATGRPQKFITLPKTAIAYNPYGDTVYVVEKQTKKGKAVQIAKQVFVSLGETRGDQVAVTKGLEPGEIVVTSGQVKLHSGSIVTVNNSIQLPESPNPVVPLH